MNKSMDNLRLWGLKNNVIDDTDIKRRDCWLNLSIKFRPSQKKFAAKRDNQKLEIVKYSSPVSISLNRPVINILDQVCMFILYICFFRYQVFKVTPHINGFVIAFII